MGSEPRGQSNFPAKLTHDGEFAWALLGGDDLQGGGDGLDADDGLVGVVSARYGQLQVPAHQQLWRHVLELQGGQLESWWGRGDNSLFKAALAKQQVAQIQVKVLCVQKVVYIHPLINHSGTLSICPSINEFSACLQSTISDLNCIKPDSGRAFKGFYSWSLNADVWLLHHSLNLLWICSLAASCRGFISMLMPRGGIKMLPACYNVAVDFMLLAVMSQQGASLTAGPCRPQCQTCAVRAPERSVL